MTDPDAQYYGAVLDERMIVPVEGEEVTIYPTRFGDWLASQVPSNAE